MSKDRGFFAPRNEPAASIYDAMVDEAEKRSSRSVDEWIAEERQAVLAAATTYAKSHGLRVPTLDEILAVDNYSAGHVDYAAKVAYGVAELMRNGGDE